MRAVGGDFGPIPLIFVRVTLAGFALLPLMWSTHNWQLWRQHWQKIAFIGVFITGLPFSLIAWASLSLPAGAASVINATTPLMAACWSVVLFQNRLTRRQILGLFLGICGVAVLTLKPSNTEHSEPIFWPVLAGLGATACYGWATLMSRRWLSQLSPVMLTCTSLLSCTVVMAPIALLTWPTHPISGYAWAMALGLALISTAMAYVIFYHLNAQWGSERTLVVTYLVPLFAILWAFLFLKEPLTLTMLVGGSVILAGVMILTTQPRGG